MVAVPVETAVATQPARFWPRLARPFSAGGRFADFGRFRPVFPLLPLPLPKLRVCVGARRHRRGRKREIVPRKARQRELICAFRRAAKVSLSRRKFSRIDRACAREVSCRFFAPPFCGDLDRFGNCDGQERTAGGTSPPHKTNPMDVGGLSCLPLGALRKAPQAYPRSSVTVSGTRTFSRSSPRASSLKSRPLPNSRPPRRATAAPCPASRARRAASLSTGLQRCP